MAIVVLLVVKAAIQLSVGLRLVCQQGPTFWAMLVVRSSTFGATVPPRTWEAAEPRPGRLRAVNDHQAVCGLHQQGVPGLDRSPQDRCRARVYHRDQPLHARYEVALIASWGEEGEELLDAAETAEHIGQGEYPGCICCWEDGPEATRVWVP